MSGAPIRTTFQYLLWEYLIISDFDLGELEPPGEDERQRGTLRIERASQSDWAQPGGRVVIEDLLDNGDIWFQSWAMVEENGGRGYIAHFPGLCSFRIQPGEMRIECAPAPSVGESTIVHLILDQAIPRLLSLKEGYVILHASAVQAGNQVFAIMGHSGQGKSTLATWFGAQGFPLLTDDCLVLRKDELAPQWLAQSSYHSVRLWPDSVDALGIKSAALREFAHYSSKRRTSKHADFQFASGKLPLKACFLLTDAGASGESYSDGPILRPLSINEAFISLVQGVFRLDVQDVQLNRRELEVLTSLTETVRFYSLAYKREYDALPAVQKAMIETVEGLPPRG